MDQEDDNNNDNDNNLNNELNNMNIDNRSKKNPCLYCLKDVQGSSRCSRCRTALYCDRYCQEKHWPVHKNSCKNSNNEDNDKKLEMKALNYSKQGNCVFIYTHTIIIINQIYYIL